MGSGGALPHDLLRLTALNGGRRGRRRRRRRNQVIEDFKFKFNSTGKEKPVACGLGEIGHSSAFVRKRLVSVLMFYYVGKK